MYIQVLQQIIKGVCTEHLKVFILVNFETF